MDTFERGRREFEVWMGSPPEEYLAEVRRRSPRLYEAVVGQAFGQTLANGGMERTARATATIAVLAAIGGAEAQLAAHARAALRQGMTAAELRALCEYVALYAGLPRALNALAVVDQVAVDAGLPRPPAERLVRLPDHETLVARQGETGPAVLLVHALGLDWRAWEAVMPSLAVGRQVFAYDVRGHGRAAGSPGPFTMADVADDLARVLDALGLERAHLVGLSYGGAIVQTAAVAHPERCASLALLATTDHPLDAFEGRARAAEADGMEAQVAPTLTRWFTPEGLANGGWGVRYARERVLRGSPADWAAAWRAFSGLDVQGRLAAFAAPTLVLAGERDVSTTPEIMSAIAARIPGAVYRELPGTPHMQALERPDLVAAALDAFLPAGA